VSDTGSKKYVKSWSFYLPPEHVFFIFPAGRYQNIALAGRSNICIFFCNKWYLLDTNVRVTFPPEHTFFIFPAGRYQNIALAGRSGRS
jgi:hypothetical protein